MKVEIVPIHVPIREVKITMTMREAQTLKWLLGWSGRIPGVLKDIIGDSRELYEFMVNTYGDLGSSDICTRVPKGD